MTQPSGTRAGESLRPKARDWLNLAILIIVWGSAYGMTSVALSAFDPALLVSIRLWIGAAFLGVACKAVGASLPAFSDQRAWAAIILIAATGTLIPFSLISRAQTEVPSALAAIYIAAAPLCVAVLAHVLVASERLTLAKAIGVCVGFCGVATLFVPGLLPGLHSGHGLGGLPLVPQILLLGGALCYAISGILVRLSGLSVHPIAMSFGFCQCAAIMSVPLAMLSGAEWPTQVSLPAVLAALGLGIFSTGIGALVYVLSIRSVGAMFTSNVGNLAPFWSLLVGTVLLGETLPVTAFMGLALILSGIVLVQRQAKA